MPAFFPTPRSKLWCCAEYDIDEEFLGTFALPPLVITCKPSLVPHVQQACEAKGCENILFNFAFAGKDENGHYREERWSEIMLGHIKPALDEGREVIIHCHAGVHRAAMVFVHTLVFGFGMSYTAAIRELTSIRDVKLHQVLDSVQRRDGSETEAHSRYLPAWEKWAFSEPKFRFARGLPAPVPEPVELPEPIEISDDEAEVPPRPPRPPPTLEMLQQRPDWPNDLPIDRQRE